MLNEEKIILMTKLASYEAHEGKKNMKIGRYFRSDYIAVQVLKAVLCATIGFALVFALYIFYDFETFMQDIYKIDLIEFAKNVLLYYIILVAVYGVAVYGICTYRYVRTRKRLKLYYQNLKKLNSMYNEG